LHRIMEHAVGQEVPANYLPLLREELSASGDDLRAPQWTKSDIAPDHEFTVAIIGSGMSGLLAAHRLKQVGVSFTIYEKGDDVGGTWSDNVYPGCRVDVPSHMYSYSFSQRHDWPNHFSPQSVLLEYFRDCADEFGLRDHIKFGTEVEEMRFSADSANWTLRLRTKLVSATVTADAVISAVGQLNRPALPDIDGRDEFIGLSFHSAQWPKNIDFTGKRVAVIGNGASAIQFIPIIAEQVEHLTVFQRTPNWFFPAPQYHQKVPPGLQWLFQHLPGYAQWYRFWLFWRLSENVLPACRVVSNWDGDESSISPLNDELRELLTMYLDFQFSDRPDLRDKVVPKYPPAAKRIVVDNGAWATALKRDNVALVTDRITKITQQGVCTADGTEHRADIIVYATGFHASEFLSPMSVIGRNGVDLHQQWGGNARAYLGISMPNFPNFFCLYGPNTNVVVNGSIIFFSECEVHYVIGCLKLLLEGDKRTLECRQDVHDSYNALVDQGNSQMAWGVSKVNSWYKNRHGRVAQNWPFSLIDFWERTRAPAASDYFIN
ncbi:MAG: NAD(P)/FAD-dependent oxidoreductase, partial [Ilumatobacteraceae bacterium]